MKLGVTGSRYFGGNRPDSDLDFYTEDSQQTRFDLMAKGFHEIRITGKAGPNLAGVFRNGNREVHLYKCLARKEWEMKVAGFAPIRTLMRFAPKPLRTAIWQGIQRL